MKKFKEYLAVTYWVFRIYWKISKVLTATVIATEIILRLQVLVSSFIFGVALDRIIVFTQTKEINQSDLAVVIGLFIGSHLFFSIVQVLSNRASGFLSNLDGWKLRQLLYSHLHSLGLSKLEDSELTNKVTRFNELLGSINSHLTMTVWLVSSIFTIFTTAAVIAGVMPELIPFALALFCMKFLVNQNYVKQFWDLTRNSTEDRRRAAEVSHYLSDAKLLKELFITKGFTKLKDKYETFVDWYIGRQRVIYTRWMRMEFVQSFFDTALLAGGLYLIITKGVTGAITVGAITFYIRTLGSFTAQLDGMSYRIARNRESAIRIKDAQEIFELYEPDNDGDLELSTVKEPPHLEFSNVEFQYPNSPKPVLKNINLVIKKGEKVAIVGENGAGKTTFVKLLTRLYRVNKGEILVDSNNIDRLKIRSFYNKIGVLFQDYNTYDNLSVSDNVTIGKVGKVRVSKLKEALRKAQATEFVNAYPHKTKQILSERYKGGIRPSTGQWQKLAIARFFYRNAQLLILDEPTAAIDAISEAEIFDNIYKFMKGKTVIIISHRFSTVRNADRILVMDNGEIVEDGSHEELLKLKGKYAKAFKLQAKGYS